MTKILVLGAYGLIGAACVRALEGPDRRIIGMGRDGATARRTFPGIEWIIADIAALSVEDWQRHLAGIDVVVNAAGALQDGPRDGLRAIHDTAVERLCVAAAGSALRLVQVSAAGVAPDADTAFFRTKARGDAHVAASGLEWIILRPALVIGRNAFGGSALLRGAAGMPGVGLRLFERRAVQTVALDDLAGAVADCALGLMPSGRSYDLGEPSGRSLGDTVALIRGWLGFAPARVRLRLPAGLLRLVGYGADGLGLLGWRSPLRTTALRTLAGGILADTAPWQAAGGRPLRALPDTLAAMPATLQDRWFARLYLLLPLSVAVLSLFWLVSGLIGIWQSAAAVRLLTDRGFAPGLAQAAVFAGAAGDILVGALVLYRPWARAACLGMVALCLSYMAGAAVFAPGLWADPLGPMVKVLPAVGLSLVALAMLEDR